MRYYNGQKRPILADFSMGGMEAEFAAQPGEKKRSGLGKKVAIGAAGLTAAGAAGRYGTAAVKGGMKTAKQNYRRGGLAKAGFGGAKTQLKSDIRAGKRAAGKAKSAIGAGLAKLGAMVKRAK